VKKLDLAIVASAALAALCIAPAASGQAYPTKPVELVVAFQPGGGVDSMARVFAEAARPLFPQPFVVVNKPGASGAIGLTYVASAPADGYKVAMIFAELLTIPLVGIGKVNSSEFEPIARLASDPGTVTVRADAPWNSVEELIAHAKANPGKVTFSNAGNASISHIAAAALAQKTGTQFVHVPYQGSGPAVVGLVGGQVDATAVNYAVVAPQVAAGKLKVLAVMSDKRLPAQDKAPTLRERGIDVTIDVWRGIAVAKDTAKDIVGTLRGLAAKVMQDPKLLEVLRTQNLTAAYQDGPDFARELARQGEWFKQTIPALDLKN